MPPYQYNLVMLDMMGDVNGLMHQASIDHGAHGWQIVGSAFIPNAKLSVGGRENVIESPLVLMMLLQREAREPNPAVPQPGLCRMTIHPNEVEATWAMRDPNDVEWVPACEACMRKAPDEYKRMRLRAVPKEEPS